MSRRCILEVTPEQEEQLRVLARSSRREDADRARAVLMSLEGKTSLDIAPVLGVRPEQIRRWRTRFPEGGPGALGTRPRCGRPDIKAQAALSVAREVLEKENGPAPRSVPWTLPRLAAEVHRRTDHCIAPAYLSVVLRKKGAIEGSGQDTALRIGRMRRR